MAHFRLWFNILCVYCSGCHLDYVWPVHALGGSVAFVPAVTSTMQWPEHVLGDGVAAVLAATLTMQWPVLVLGGSMAVVPAVTSAMQCQ